MIRSHFINVTQVLKYKSVGILPNLRDAWVCCTQHISAHSSTPRSQSASAKGMPLRAPCPMMGREVLINQLNGPNLGRQRRETHETTVLQSSRKDSARIISIDPVHPQCRPCLFLLGLSNKCSVLMAWNGGHQSFLLTTVETFHRTSRPNSRPRLSVPSCRCQLWNSLCASWAVAQSLELDQLA